LPHLTPVAATISPRGLHRLCCAQTNSWYYHSPPDTSTALLYLVSTRDCYTFPILSPRPHYLAPPSLWRCRPFARCLNDRPISTNMVAYAVAWIRARHGPRSTGLAYDRCRDVIPERVTVGDKMVQAVCTGIHQTTIGTRTGTWGTWRNGGYPVRCARSLIARDRVSSLRYRDAGAYRTGLTRLAVCARRTPTSNRLAFSCMGTNATG